MSVDVVAGVSEGQAVQLLCSIVAGFVFVSDGTVETVCRGPSQASVQMTMDVGSPFGVQGNS